MTRDRCASSGSNLQGYLVKFWQKGVVVKQRQFPPTPKGKRAAERLKRQRKQAKPGRPSQAVTVTPIYETVALD